VGFFLPRSYTGRFIRILRENLLWIKTFRTIKELRFALLEFREWYSSEWLFERHGYRMPAEIREEQLTSMAEAAKKCLLRCQ
jgi:putative transposase